MALVSIKLTKSALDHTHIDIEESILQYNPSREKTTRKIIRKFVEKHEGDKIIVFADQAKDKLGNLVILQQECDRVNIELTISLYRKDENHYSEHFGEYYFREVDLSLSEELKNMAIW